jgi:hypothetical protein
MNRAEQWRHDSWIVSSGDRTINAATPCLLRAPALHRITFLAVLALAACGPSGPETLAWSEQVQLSDGRIAVLERQERYHTTQEFGGLGELHTDRSRLSLSLPDGTKLPPLDVGEMPLVFDIELGTSAFFVITIIDNCPLARKRGLDSRQPYIEYRLTGTEWRSAPVSSDKIGWAANLLITRKLTTGTALSLAEKRAKDSSPGIGDIYRRVSAHVPC